MSGKIFLEYDKCKTIFCELKNCNCGKKKSWNRSDKKNVEYLDLMVMVL